jgi:cobalt-zinc-cadmium efflux system protein
MVIPAGRPGDAYLMEIAHHLKEDFGIHHATMQVETDPRSTCALAPDHVV